MKTHRATVLYFLSVVFIVSFLACAGSPSQTQKDDPTAEQEVSGVEEIVLASLDSIPMRTPLGGMFDNIVIRRFETTEQYKEDYPHACEDVKRSMIKQLKSKKRYKNVTDDPNQSLSGKSVFVDMTVVDMRIAGGAARFWGGALVGNSYMKILLELRDADIDEILHKKILSSSNNAFGAAWSGGSSDMSLPSDLGTLMGQYVSTIVPYTN